MSRIVMAALTAVMIFLGVAQGPEALRLRTMRRSRTSAPFVQLKV